jgi:hypothetical protein
VASAERCNPSPTAEQIAEAMHRAADAARKFTPYPDRIAEFPRGVDDVEESEDGWFHIGWVAAWVAHDWTPLALSSKMAPLFVKLSFMSEAALAALLKKPVAAENPANAALAETKPVAIDPADLANPVMPLLTFWARAPWLVGAYGCTPGVPQRPIASGNHPAHHEGVPPYAPPDCERGFSKNSSCYPNCGSTDAAMASIRSRSSSSSHCAITRLAPASASLPSSSTT